MSPTWLHWPSTWTPSDLTSLVAWYKADAITGLSDSDPVSTWSDESASGWDATASGTDRPTYKTAIQNGLPVVRFNGSNHLNLGSTDLFRNVGGGAVYAVVKDDAVTTRGDIFNVPTFGSANSRFVIRTGGSGANNDRYQTGGRRLDSDAPQALASANSVSSNWTIFGAVADYLQTSLSLYVDGGIDGQSTSYLTSGLTSNTPTNASNTNIGALDTSNTNALDGDLAEIVVTHSALSTADRERLEGYLAHKWGLQSNLPSTHPYRNSAP